MLKQFLEKQIQYQIIYQTYYIFPFILFLVKIKRAFKNGHQKIKKHHLLEVQLKLFPKVSGSLLK
jgi:hypothetical protein